MRAAAGLLPDPQIWFLVTEHIKRVRKKKEKFIEFQGISCSSLSHHPYWQQYMRRLCRSVNQTEDKQGFCEYRIWDGKDIALAVSNKHFPLGLMKKRLLFGFSLLTVSKSTHMYFPSPEMDCHHQDNFTLASVNVCLCGSCPTIFSAMHHQLS